MIPLKDLPSRVGSGEEPTPKRKFIPIGELPKKQEAQPEKEKPSYMKGVGEGVMSGMIKMGTGAADLVGDTLNLVPGAQNWQGLQDFRKNTEDTEITRRDVSAGIKNEYGRPGITNPVSIGEFVGETAPLVAVSGIRGAQAASRLLPTSWLGTAAEGVMTGGALGAIQPTVGNESRTMNSTIGGVAGGIFAPATRAVIEGTQMAAPAVGRLVRKVTGQERLAVSRVDREAAKLMEGPNKLIENGLRKIAPRTPAEVQTPRALAAAVKNDHAATSTIMKLRDDITFTRHGQEVSGVRPETLGEALSATSQSIAKIGTWTDEIAGAAGKRGARVSAKPIIDELAKVTESNGYLSQAATAERWATKLNSIEEQGGFTVPSAIRAMTELNNDIKSLFTGKNVSGDSPELLGLVANKLRKSLNDTLESFEGGAQFGEYRRSLGQLMNLERRLLKTVEREANRESRGSLSIFDIIGAEQLIRGAARMRPAGIIESAASFATGKALKLLSSKDRAVRSVFRAAEHVNAGAKLKGPVLPTLPEQLPAPKLFTDPSTGKVRSAADYR